MLPVLRRWLIFLCPVPVILDPTSILRQAAKDSLTKDPGFIVSLGPDQMSLGWNSGLNFQRADCCSIANVEISNDAKNKAENYSFSGLNMGLIQFGGVGLDENYNPTDAFSIGVGLARISHAS